ncbi:hypothetical protein [Dolichospermum sp. UHCC 0259]|uniref:hypothetical protein n=1 Tax=Dolichospermum sp. UHCC 0259 TaxID=2590010 RepID=UPI001447CA17|nr:hypothetical protein [Dolichospermum sp. UHCC 0259]
MSKSVDATLVRQEGIGNRQEVRVITNYQLLAQSLKDELSRGESDDIEKAGIKNFRF